MPTQFLLNGYLKYAHSPLQYLTPKKLVKAIIEVLILAGHCLNTGPRVPIRPQSINFRFNDDLHHDEQSHPGFSAVLSTDAGKSSPKHEESMYVFSLHLVLFRKSVTIISDE